jgi:hypothetical protein
MADLARRLHPMLVAVLPPRDDEGNLAADVADGILAALDLSFLSPTAVRSAAQSDDQEPR